MLRAHVAKALRQLLLLLPFAIYLGCDAHAAPSETAILSTMNRIGSLWKQTIQSGTWFEYDCIGGAVALNRFTSTDLVSMDVRKTDSLLNPYVGIITVDGTYETNSHSLAADGAMDELVTHRTICFKSSAAAWGHVTPADISLGNEGYHYHYEIYYHFEDGYALFAGGNNIFENGMKNEILLSRNSHVWGPLLRRSLTSK